MVARESGTSFRMCRTNGRRTISAFLCTVTRLAPRSRIRVPDQSRRLFRRCCHASVKIKRRGDFQIAPAPTTTILKFYGKIERQKPADVFEALQFGAQHPGLLRAETIFVPDSIRGVG